jgi:hypothetical protein
LGSMLFLTIPSCKDDDKEGCTDPNADNYDSKADKNKDCRYRYASNIDITSIPTTKPGGSAWDDDNSGPDLKLNFGKSTSSTYDYTTNTGENGGTSVTLMPNGSVQYTNEEWKFQLVDVDALSSEVIASGTFNPLKSTTENVLEVQANGVTFKFKYTIK